MADKRTRLSDMTKAGRKAEKPTVIGAIRDPQFVRDLLQGLGETATRGITGVLGAPVDITTMAMRPFGYSVPAEQVVGGSEYLGKQLERAGMLSGNRNQLSELLAGLVTPDPLDVAKLGAMAVPVVGRAMRQAPRDEAMRIAQANAAKPISEGGLGLPPDNTAMDRAKAMGFKESGYTGTNKDFRSYDVTQAAGSGSGSREGPLGAWLTDDPRVAQSFAEWSSRGQGGDVIYPLMIRGNKPYEPTSYTEIKEILDANTRFVRPPYRMMQDEIDYEAAKKAIENKGDYVALRNTMTDAIDKPITQYLVPNTSRLRSRFAAFDPARRYESDLLGAADPRLLGAIGLGTAGALYKTNREQEKDRKREK